MARRPVAVAALPLLASFLLLACDSKDRPEPTLVRVTGVSAAAGSELCIDRAAQLLDLTRDYSSDVRGVRQDCPGDNCVALAAITQASFNAVSAGHANLLFACSPASPESCDGVDNDKDGTVDNGFDKGATCTAGVGACLSYGVKICAADASGTLCTAQSGTPTFETCDGVDNDCNGTVDDGYNVGTVCTTGVGACLRYGFRICTATGGTTCNIPNPATPGTEICGDGIDNDCDGEVDEGCGG